jgi:putative ABC transport system permease protein
MFLAWRNLIHDKVRLAVTLTGIVFAIVLIVVQFGLFLGFRDTSANVIEHSGADVWIAARGTPHLNGGTPFPESKLYKILSTAGVASAQRYLISFVGWKLPDGGMETCADRWLRSRDRTRRTVESELPVRSPDLHTDDTVIVDELYFKKLAVMGSVTRRDQRPPCEGGRASRAAFAHSQRRRTSSHRSRTLRSTRASSPTRLRSCW